MIAMELYQEILSNILHQELARALLSTPPASINELLQSACYQAFEEIKAAVAADSLDAPDCFMKIERIVRVLEDLGRNSGTRHDFG